jgi:hypothetical protein
MMSSYFLSWPRLDKLLNSNEVPPPKEEALIQHYIRTIYCSDACEPLPHYEDHPLSKHQTCRIINSRSHLLQMPNEILHYIFKMTLDYDRTPDFIAASSMQTVWALSRVCRRWREATVGLPYFWRSISLSALPLRERRRGSGQWFRPDEPSKGYLQLLQLQISRAQRSELSIQISPNAPSYQSPVFKVIQPCFTQCAALEVDYGWMWMQNFEGGPHPYPSFPSLRTLCLSGKSLDDVSHNPLPYTARLFMHSKRLERVYLRNLRVLNELHLPSHSLGVIDGHSPDTGPILGNVLEFSALQKVPNLESLKVRAWKAATNPLKGQFLPELELPRLRKLELQLLQPETNMLDTLTSPVLDELAISPPDTHPPSYELSQHSISAFIKRSESKLKALRLNEIPSIAFEDGKLADSVQEILQASPELKTISIRPLDKPSPVQLASAFKSFASLNLSALETLSILQPLPSSKTRGLSDSGYLDAEVAQIQHIVREAQPAWDVRCHRDHHENSEDSRGQGFLQLYRASR